MAGHEPARRVHRAEREGRERMSEVWMMFAKGAGIGAWVVGAALVLTVALPVFGVMFALIGRVLGGRRNSDEL